MNAKTKLTVDMVEKMTRNQMLEMLEDMTAMESDDIRRMTSANMRKELMGLAKPAPKERKSAPRQALENAVDKQIESGSPVVVEIPAKPKAAKKGKKKAPKECMCGCGGMTKGGRFQPGHDARYYSAMRKLESGSKATAHAKAS